MKELDDPPFNMATDKAISAVLALKAKLDRNILPMDLLDILLLKRMFAKGNLYNGWHEREEGEAWIIRGCIFVEAILPFSYPHYSDRDSEFGYTDPFYVLAGKYISYPDIDITEGNETADWLDSQSEEDSWESAHYVQIGELPIIVASEGKNRVSLYRNLKRPIGAMICKSPYPNPEELQLVRLRPFGGVGLRYIGNDSSITRALRSDNWVHLSNNLSAVAFKESVHLLKSLGVAWGKPEWCFREPIVKRKIHLEICRRRYLR